MKKNLSTGLVISAMLLLVGCGGGGGDDGVGEQDTTVVDGQTIDISQLTNNTDIWVVKNVNQAEIDRLTQYAKQSLDPGADIVIANVSCTQLGAYNQEGTSESLSDGLVESLTYFFQNSGRPDNNFYCKEYSLSANAAKYGDSSYGDLTVAIGGWNNDLDQSLHNFYFNTYGSVSDSQTNPPVTNPPASNVIELIPNKASAEINASNPVDVDVSTVVSIDQQTIVLAKDTPVSVDRPLFIDGLYQGIIDSVETNTDGTITVTLRDAENLSEILDTLSINFDTSEGVVSSKTSGSTTQKLSLSNISLYDKQNTNKMSYSLRNDKSKEGINEPVLRIDIPENYKIPVAVKNEKIDCSTLDVSCEAYFELEESDRINLGETTTQNGITFSTKGSFVEIGLGMTLELFADINIYRDDVFTFNLNQSAYFESNLTASIDGDLSADLEREIPLTQTIHVSIPISPVVTAKIELQPILIIGANGEIKGKVVVLSHMLREGTISFKFDSRIDGGNQLQQSESIQFIPTNINEDGVEVDINASGNAYATAGVKMTPSISLKKLLDIDFGNIRGGIKSSANIEGEIDSGFAIVNNEASANIDAMARLWVEMYPTIDYKLNVVFDPIKLDPIPFYSQDSYALLYQGDTANIFDWQVSLLNAPTVIQTPSSGDVNVTFDIEADASIKNYIKFYYTTDGSDPIESSNNRWNGSPIVITEDTTITVKAVLHVSDYSTSLWSFGTSTSMSITEEVVPSECPGEINSEGVCIVSTYYESGVLKRATPYVNDVIDGTEKSYYESGELELETPYVNGAIYGTEYRYNSDGSILAEIPYVNGVIHGIKYLDLYYIETIIVNTYVNGVKHGTEYNYDYNGSWLEIPYENGDIHGTKYSYDSNGTLIYSELFIFNTSQGRIYN